MPATADLWPGHCLHTYPDPGSWICCRCQRRSVSLPGFGRGHTFDKPCAGGGRLGSFLRHYLGIGEARVTDDEERARVREVVEEVRRWHAKGNLIPIQGNDLEAIHRLLAPRTETLEVRPDDAVIARLDDGDFYSMSAIEGTLEALKIAFPDNRCIVASRHVELTTLREMVEKAR